MSTYTIARDQSGRLHISTECGAFTVIPADFSYEDGLPELGGLHTEQEACGECEPYAEWLTAYNAAF